MSPPPAAPLFAPAPAPAPCLLLLRCVLLAGSCCPCPCCCYCRPRARLPLSRCRALACCLHVPAARRLHRCMPLPLMLALLWALWRMPFLLLLLQLLRCGAGLAS